MLHIGSKIIENRRSKLEGAIITMEKRFLPHYKDVCNVDVEENSEIVQNVVLPKNAQNYGRHIEETDVGKKEKS